MSELISSEARAWIGREAPEKRIDIHRSDIIKYSVATEQKLEKYRNGDEAPPMFLFGALRPVAPIDELTPDGLAVENFIPDLPLKRVMAGGFKQRFHRPIKAGDKLVAKQSLGDLFEKQGASGPLIFLVYQLKVETEAGELVMEEQQTRIFR